MDLLVCYIESNEQFGGAIFTPRERLPGVHVMSLCALEWGLPAPMLDGKHNGDGHLFHNRINVASNLDSLPVAAS